MLEHLPPDAARGGKLVFEHAVFRPEESPEHRLVVYSAVPVANTPEKLRRLLGERSSPQPTGSHTR